MSSKLENIEYRLERAVNSGNYPEFLRLIEAGAAVPNSLTEREQAQWLEAAVSSENDASAFIDALLTAGFSPSSVNDQLGPDYESTPFVKAAKIGRLDLMQQLADAGADIHWNSRSGANAASIVFPSNAPQAPRDDSTEYREIRQWLAVRGVELNPACEDSRRKLLWAGHQSQSWGDIPALLELGIDPAPLRWTPIMWKIVKGDATVEDVEALEEHELAKTDSQDRDAFLLAVEAERADLVRAFVSRGHDLLTKAWCGKTALHLTAKNGDTGMTELLLKLGHPVDAPNDFGDTALSDAVYNPAIVRILLEHGANVNHKDQNGYGAINEADSLEVFELLLDAGADIDDISGGGDWPLKCACEDGDSELVNFLLKRGASVDLTSTGETALHAAVRAASLECVRILLEAGADVNAEDVDGWTCLWYVESAEMARFLLEKGADPTVSDMCGGVPEDWGLPVEVTKIYKAHQRSEGQGG